MESAKLENVILMELIEHCNLANSIVFYQDRVKTDVVKIDAYGKYRQIEKYKVFCENGFVFVCDSNEIQFYKFSGNDKNLINYWKACTRELKEEAIRDIMSQQYDDLVVNPNSVLYSYINQRNYKDKDDNTIICPFSFNNSQLKAIRLALDDKISIIKGPPGTGKTETILNIISNLIIRGKSIAIISSNNSAIENVEEKLNKRGYGYLLASLGNGERKAEFFNKTSNEFQKEKVDRISIPLEKLSTLSRLFESENKSKRLKEEIDSINLEKEYYENFNKDSLINVDKYKFKNSQALIEYVTHYQEDTKEKQFTLRLWLKLIFKYGFKKSLIRAKDRDKVITSLEHKYYSLKVKESTDELSELEHLLAKNKLEDLKSEYKTLSKQYLDYNNSLNLSFIDVNGELEVLDVKNQNVKQKNEAFEEANAIADYIHRNNIHNAYIITPFVNQRELILKLLRGKGINDVDCGTIHSMQGAEKDTIIFSPAISPKTSKNTFAWIKDNYELINVAITRAKNKLVIAADTEVIDLKSDKKDDLYNLIQYAKNNGTIQVPPNESIKIEIGKSNGSVAEDEFFKTVSHFCSCYTTFEAERNVKITKIIKSGLTPNLAKMEFDLVLYNKLYGRKMPVIAFEVNGGEHFGVVARERSDKIKKDLCEKNHIELVVIPNYFVKAYEDIAKVILISKNRFEGIQMSMFDE